MERNRTERNQNKKDHSEKDSRTACKYFAPLAWDAIQIYSVFSCYPIFITNK